MNDSDTEANTKAIDSLLNYETVKYFGAEEREAERYDRSMERYEDASVKTYTSLAVLNTGQADHLHRRPHRDHADVRDRRAQRHQHGRRFRHDQRHDDPALPAAEFHGHGLSRDQAGDHRHREDVQRAGAQSRDQGYPGRQAAGGELGQSAFRGRAVCLRAGSADPQRPQLRGAGRQDGRDRRALRRRQVDDLAAAVPPL